MDPTPTPPVTAILLAGGEGRRMGGQDKGLIPLRDKPLAEWVLSRIRPQTSEILISANRNLEAYEALGYPVVRDKTEGYVGPLAGIARGLLDAKNDLVLSVPCDTPFLPDDLVARLYAALSNGDHDLAVPLAAGRTQNAICLMHRNVGSNLATFLSQGGRKVMDWQAGLKLAVADFSDEAGYFVNINSPEQLAALGAKGRQGNS
jgi:molybdopterin-guanine dinucleotide biosynthesis protein A